MSKAKTVKEESPGRHKQHLVMRNGFIFTATPCYGMHPPLWVVKTMGDKNCGEVEPVVMLETDQHMPLNDAVILYHKDGHAADVERLMCDVREMTTTAKYLCLDLRGHKFKLANQLENEIENVKAALKEFEGE